MEEAQQIDKEVNDEKIIHENQNFFSKNLRPFFTVKTLLTSYWLNALKFSRLLVTGTVYSI